MNKNNRVERWLSLGLGVGFAVWDAYAQAHGIPYGMPSWLYGIVLYPYGEKAWNWGKDQLRKKNPRRLKGDNENAPEHLIQQDRTCDTD